MSKLTEFQIYAVVKSCEATAERHRADGNERAETAALKRAAAYRAELKERFDKMMAENSPVPIGAVLDFGQAPTLEQELSARERDLTKRAVIGALDEVIGGLASYGLAKGGEAELTIQPDGSASLIVEDGVNVMEHRVFHSIGELLGVLCG